MNHGGESPRCPDAIVVVPGIGGSELRRGRELIWGASLKVAAAGLVSGRLFDDLRGDLVPGGLVRFPTLLPGIGRFDPYQRLTRAMRELAVHRDAVLEFPYDWRRSIEESAAALAEAAGEHLERWRRHPGRGSGEPLLSFVCHSMGGLVARYSAEVLGDRSRIRQIITLGTPFGGSVRALRLLADGRVLKAGLLSEKLRRLARELPGVHDLLPSYPALATRSGSRWASRAPTAADLLAAGATAKLLDRALSARRRVEEAVGRNGPSSCPIVPLVGVNQPTLQTFRLEQRGVEFEEHIDGRDWKGDGTVYFGASYPPGQTHHSPLPMQHGALASSNEGIQYVRYTLLGRALGPPQGDGVGVAAPDAAFVGESFAVRITGRALAGASCRYDEAGGSVGVGVPVRREGDHVIATMALPRAGLYTITVSGGGFSPVRVDVLVVDRDE